MMNKFTNKMIISMVSMMFIQLIASCTNYINDVYIVVPLKKADKKYNLIRFNNNYYFDSEGEAYLFSESELIKAIVRDSIVLDEKHMYLDQWIGAYDFNLIYENRWIDLYFSGGAIRSLTLDDTPVLLIQGELYPIRKLDIEVEYQNLKLSYIFGDDRIRKMGLMRRLIAMHKIEEAKILKSIYKYKYQISE